MTDDTHQERRTGPVDPTGPQTRRWVAEDEPDTDSADQPAGSRRQSRPADPYLDQPTTVHHFNDIDDDTGGSPGGDPDATMTWAAPTATAAAQPREDDTQDIPAEVPETPPAPPRHRPPVLVWVLTALQIALMLMCTFLYPAFAGPTEARQVDLVYSFVNGNAFYAPGTRLESAGVATAAAQHQFPPASPLSGQTVTPRGQRQSLDALGGDRVGQVRLDNPLVAHPPLYYMLAAGVVKAFPNSSQWPYDRTIAVLRYLSILLLAPLPLLLWAAARRLSDNGPAAVIAAALPIAVPGLSRLGGSVSNLPLLILLTASLTLLLAKVLTGDLRIRTGVIAGILTGLACLTQGFALVLPVAVIAAYVLSWLRHRRSAWAPALWAVGLTVAIGGWWWIRSLVLYGSLQPDGLGSDGVVSAAGAAPQHAWGDLFRSLVLGSWGGIGLPDSPRFSGPFSWVWVTALLAGVVVALILGVGRGWGRATAAVFVLPALLTLGLVIINARPAFLATGDVSALQGRFLYAAMAWLFVLCGIGVAQLLGRAAARWVPLIVVTAGLVTQAWAWRQLIHGWWAPATNSSSTEIGDAFRAVLRWSPWSHAVTTGPFIAVAALGVLAGILALAYIRPRGEGGSRGYGTVRVDPRVARIR